MRTDADHMTILCGECGLEPGEACSFLCLGWVTREEIEEHSLDVRVIVSYRTPAGFGARGRRPRCYVPPARHLPRREPISYTQYLNARNTRMHEPW